MTCVYIRNATLLLLFSEKKKRAARSALLSMIPQAILQRRNDDSCMTNQWMKQLAVLLITFGSCCLGYFSSAQVAVPFKSKTGDSTHTVYIWHSDTLREI